MTDTDRTPPTTERRNRWRFLAEPAPGVELWRLEGSPYIYLQIYWGEREPMVPHVMLRPLPPAEAQQLAAALAAAAQPPSG